MTNLSRSSQLTRYQQTSAAVKKFLANVSSLPIGGQEMTPAQIAAEYDGLAASAEAVQAATAARTAAIKTDRDKKEAAAPFVKGFTSIVQGMFAQAPDTLAAFGLNPRKAPAKSVATKAGALLKNRATRKARGTMGKKQKAQITGTLGASDLAVIGALAPGAQGSAASASAPATPGATSPSASPAAAAPASVPTPTTNGAAATPATSPSTKS